MKNKASSRLDCESEKPLSFPALWEFTYLTTLFTALQCPLFLQTLEPLMTRITRVAPGKETNLCWSVSDRIYGHLETKLQAGPGCRAEVQGLHPVSLGRGGRKTPTAPRTTSYYVLKTGLKMMFHLRKRHGFSPVHLFLMFNKLTGATISEGLRADLLVTPTQTNHHQAVRTCTVSILQNRPHEKGAIPPIPPNFKQLFVVFSLKRCGGKIFHKGGLETNRTGVGLKGP